MERYIKDANLPGSNVSLVLIDMRARQSIISNVERLGIKVIRAERCDDLYEAVSCHPDMFIHHIGGDSIIVAPNAPLNTIHALKEHGFNIIKGQKTIGSKYPQNIAYNVARMGDYAICNVQHCDCVLIQYLHDVGTKIIDVKQGYAKCSICIAGEGIIITSDEGLYKSLAKYDFEMLKISPGYIGLKGLEYGFIGGASGLLSEKLLGFSGDISTHPDFDKIQKFLLKNGINYKALDNKDMMDIGTIIPLKEYCI